MVYIADAYMLLSELGPSYACINRRTRSMHTSTCMGAGWNMNAEDAAAFAAAQQMQAAEAAREAQGGGAGQPNLHQD